VQDASGRAVDRGQERSSSRTLGRPSSSSIKAGRPSARFNRGGARKLITDIIGRTHAGSMIALHRRRRPTDRGRRWKSSGGPARRGIPMVRNLLWEALFRARPHTISNPDESGWRCARRYRRQSFRRGGESVVLDVTRFLARKSRTMGGVYRARPFATRRFRQRNGNFTTGRRDSATLLIHVLQRRARDGEKTDRSPSARSKNPQGLYRASFEPAMARIEVPLHDRANGIPQRHRARRPQPARSRQVGSEAVLRPDG